MASAFRDRTTEKALGKMKQLKPGRYSKKMPREIIGQRCNAREERDNRIRKLQTRVDDRKKPQALGGRGG